MPSFDKAKRMDAVTGWLRAYSRGWVSYSKAHVLALQKERLKLIADMGQRGGQG